MVGAETSNLLGSSELPQMDSAGSGRGSGFVAYTQDTFRALRRQHNIMALVGNGFDIQVLHDYDRPVDSRYEPFYHYLKMRGFNPGNLLLKHMEEELKNGRKNWSDIEAAVAAAVNARGQTPARIFNDLRPIQAEFAEFLQDVVPTALLGRLGEDAVANEWSMRSLSEFLRDLTDQSEFQGMQFPIEAGNHYHLFNFLFVNFNYTNLLDNYVYLDQIQFEPRRHRTVDTNFAFRNDPRGHLHASNATDAGQSGYVLTDVIHPHGILSTPRSLLFGIDADDDYDQAQDAYNQLKKPYWAQSNVHYRSHFGQTELFIIFGCSLGDSDGWWWRNIAMAIRDRGSELIIYRRQDSDGHTIASVKARFLDAAGIDVHARAEMDRRMHVILYEDSTDRVFLNTRRP